MNQRPAWRTLKQTPDQLKEVNAVLDDMRRQAEEVKVMRALPPVPPAQAQAALQSATDRLGEGARLRGLTQAVVSLGHALGMEVVAEGVETEAILAMLREQGCDQAQGYLFTRPLPAGEMSAWLAGQA